MLTAPVFQSLSVSKKPNLLTKPKFQVPAVSKSVDLLTKPVFQRSAVSKKPDLLTARCAAVLFGTHATPADQTAHIDLADCIIQFLTNNN